MMAEGSGSARKRSTSSPPHVTITMPSPDQDAKLISENSSNPMSGKENEEKLLKEQVETDSQEKAFRDKIAGASSSTLIELQQFMGNTDDYPRFVFEKLLLAFAQVYVKTIELSDVEKFYSLLDNFIRFYPDIFQRELLRDGFQLADKPDHERYGVLHAVALIGNTNLLYLVRGRNMRARNVICKALTPDAIPDDVSDSFHLVRRALLWRHMMSSSYEKVAEILRDIEKARKSTEPEELEKLVVEGAPQFQPTVAYDPWVVILAWLSLCKKYKFIMERFRKSQRKIFEEMITKLRSRGSPFSHFLTADSPAEVNGTIILQDNHEVEVKGTVQDIVKILILGKDYTSSDSYVQNINRTPSRFLDSFCARIPDSHWSPLHFAAARGDHDMVSALIFSWNLIVEKLDDSDLKGTYRRKLEKSFYDARCMTPLHYGVLKNNKEVVKVLVDWEIFGHHIDECDIFMRTAFQMACSKDERASIVQQLITDSRVNVNAKDCCNFTSLHWVVHAEAVETVKHVIFDGKERAIRALEKDRENRSPYDMAARGSERSHKEIEQLLLNHDAVKNLVERLYRDRQVYVYASNTILISAALIASVTFGGWLQPPAWPGGRDVLIFWVCNGLSFFFAVATLMSGAAAMLPVENEYIKDAVESIRGSLIRTSFLLILSVACVLGAFGAAGFASLSSILNRTAADYNNTMITIVTVVSVGGLVCGTIGLDFCERLSRVRPDWLEQAFKGTLKGLRKEDVQHMVDSFIHLPVRVFRLLQESRKNDKVFGPGNVPGPQHSPFFNILLDMAEEAKTKPPLKPLDSSLSFSDRRTPIKVDRMRIEANLRKIHPKDDIKSCPVRTCYKWLESRCLEDILQPLLLDLEQSLEDYRLMWESRPLADEVLAFLMTYSSYQRQRF